MSSGNQVKTIEEKAEGKSFFSKRNIIIIIFTTLLSIALVVITFFFIFDMNWNVFIINIGKGLTLNLGWLWLTLLILFVAAAVFYNYLPIYIRLREMGVKVKAWQYFTMSLSISFLKGVTPSNFIYDPYTIFWIKTQGVSTSKATSLMFSNALIWQLGMLLLHIPSYIVVMIKVNLLLAIGPGGVALVTLMSLGIVIDIIGCLLMALLCFSRRAHYVLSSAFNWVKKKLHMKYHTKAQIIKKYKKDATLKREVLGFYDHKIDSILVGVIYVGFELIVYFSLSSALALVNADNQFTFNVMDVFHSANMAFNANRLNIIPGFGVGLEASLLAMLQALGGISEVTNLTLSQTPKEFVSQGVFLWRSFYTYFPTIIGLFGFIGLTIYQVRSFKKKKGEFIANKYE